MHSSEAVRIMRSRPPAAQPVVPRDMLKLDSITRKRVLISGFLVLTALVFTVVSAYSVGIFEAHDPSAATASTGSQELSTHGFLEMMVYADGWEEATSSSAILCVRTQDGAPVLFHAIRANTREIVELDAGTYQVDFLPPINAGGSLYRAPESQMVEVSIGHTVNIAATLEPVAAEDAVRDDYLAVIAAFEEAATAGDFTLKGEAWDFLHGRLVTNAQSSPTFAEPEPEPEPEVDYGYYYYDYDYSWVPGSDDDSESADEEDEETSDDEDTEDGESESSGDDQEEMTEDDSEDPSSSTEGEADEGTDADVEEDADVESDAESQAA